MAAPGTTGPSFYTTDMAGGLDTKSPPNRIDPTRSPDLENVVMANMAVEARGGFVPLTRQHPKMDAIRNRGEHIKTSVASAMNTESIMVPGSLIAGDRDCYGDVHAPVPSGEDHGSLTVDFFFELDDLSEESANATDGGFEFPAGAGDNIPIRVRPIISKGPAKKTGHPHNDEDQDVFGPPTNAKAQAHWDVTNHYGPCGLISEAVQLNQNGANMEITTRQPHGIPGGGSLVKIIGSGSLANGSSDGFDGVYTATFISATVFSVPAVPLAPGLPTVVLPPLMAGHAMPFCVYLYNDGADWTFRFSSHVIDSGNFSLRTVTSTVEPRVGGLYHVIASVTWKQVMVLRIGEWNVSEQRFDYTAVELALASTDLRPLSTPCPIQVFDCPQTFIESPSTDSPVFDVATFESRPPGLDFPEGFGGYFFACKRCEGSIEDIVIRSVGLEGDADDSMDRDSKFDLANADQATLLNYWSMLDDGSRYVRDGARGNHLFFSPDVPILDDTHGNVNSDAQASWWFNGQTAHGIVDLRSDSSVRQHEQNPSPQQLEIAKSYFQLLMESTLPWCIEIEFTPDSIGEPFEQVLFEFHSFIRISLRPDGRIAAYMRDDTTNVGAVAEPRYDGGAHTTSQLENGVRYSVIVQQQAGVIRIGINGVIDDEAPDFLSAANSWPIGGITVGMGSRRFNTATQDTTAPVFADDDTRDLIEVEMDPRSGFLGHISKVSIYGPDANRIGEYPEPTEDPEPEEFTINTQRLWNVPVPSATDEILPTFANDSLDRSTLGEPLAIGGHRVAGRPFIYQTTSTTVQVIRPDRLEANAGGAVLVTGVVVAMHRKIAQWTLALWGDDENILEGRFARGLETRNEQTSLAPYAGLDEPDEDKLVLEQVSGVGDEVGLLGPMWARCQEPDILLVSARFTPRRITIGPNWETRWRARPWLQRSAREIGCAWVGGLVRALPGQQRISALVDWLDQARERQLLLMAAGRSIYRVHSLWSRESPFEVAGPFRPSFNEHSVSMIGEQADFIVCDQTGLANELLDDSNTVTFELWFKPTRLDQMRVLAAAYDAVNGQVNWCLCTHGGMVFVWGTLDGRTGTWFYHEGTTSQYAPGSVVDSRAGSQSVLPNRWNHVYILLGQNSEGSTPVVFVSGQRRDMQLLDFSPSGGFVADAFASGVPDSSSNTKLYVGGLPSREQMVTLPFSGGDTLDLHLLPSQGYITELRQGTAEEPGFSARIHDPVVVPKERYDSATVRLIHLNEGDGWVSPNEVAGGEAGGAAFQLSELETVAGGLEQSRFARYASKVWQGRAYLTNGASRMQEAVPRRDSWRPSIQVQPAGMLAPRTRSDRWEVEPSFSADSRPGVRRRNYFATAADQSIIYSVYCAFVDADSRESEPVFVGSYRTDIRGTAINVVAGVTTSFDLSGLTPAQVDLLNLGSATFEVFSSGYAPLDTPNIHYGIITTLGVSPSCQIFLDSTASGITDGFTVAIYADALRVKRVPRSTQPHVVGRVFYVSTFGGGVAVRHEKQLRDNESTEIELKSPGGVGAPGLVVGERLAPPKARLLDAGNGRLWAANLRDVGFGAPAATVAWSSTTPTYWPLNNVAIPDIPSGQSIVGIKTHLSRTYVAARNSTHVITTSGTANPLAGQVAILPQNQSVGPGGGMVLYDQLIFGASERGLYRFDGANVVYMSGELEGEWQGLPIVDEDLLNYFGVYDRNDAQFWISLRRAGMPANDRVFLAHTELGRRSWSRLLVPEHTIMESILDVRTQRPITVLGTTSGQLLAYQSEVFIDGHSDEGMPGTSQAVLDGDGTVDGTVLTPVGGGLDTIRDGLRGLSLAIVVDGVIHRRTIVKNTATTIEFAEAVPGGVQACTWVAGWYECRWSSGFIAGGSPTAGRGSAGVWLTAQEIDLEFGASPTRLEVSNVTVVQPQGQASPVVRPARDYAEVGAVEEVRDVDLTYGHLEESVPVRRAQRGRYFRIQLATGLRNGTGIRSPWRVEGWGFRFQTEGIRGGRAR